MGAGGHSRDPFLTVVPLKLLHHRLAAVDVPHIDAPILRPAHHSLVSVETSCHRIAPVNVTPVVFFSRAQETVEGIGGQDGEGGGGGGGNRDLKGEEAIGMERGGGEGEGEEEGRECVCGGVWYSSARVKSLHEGEKERKRERGGESGRGREREGGRDRPRRE